MKILLNDFQRQWSELEPKLTEAFRRVGRSGWYILGPEVARFEKELASFWSMDHAVGTANGMDAIEIALRALGVRAGDKVLTTPLSAFATTLAILKVGAVPVFADTDSTGLIDFEQCRALLKKQPDLRYFVPVHLYGHCLNLTELAALKAEFNLKVIEDCAQAIGSAWKTEGENFLNVGSVGEFATVSFYPTKNLGALGDGGAVLTQNAALAAQAACLRDYGQSSKYEHSEIGLNSRLDELQAALLMDAMLPRLTEWKERRRAIARRYLSEIRNPELRLAPPSENCRSVWHLFPVFVNHPQSRKDLQGYLLSQGVHTAVHYPKLIPDQPAFRKNVEAAPSPCPAAERLTQTELSLPIHPYLAEVEIQHVIDACCAWKSEASSR